MPEFLGARTVVASDTATVDVAVEKDTPEALSLSLGRPCLNKPGLGSRRVLGPPHGCHLRVPDHLCGNGPDSYPNG